MNMCTHEHMQQEATVGRLPARSDIKASAHSVKDEEDSDYGRKYGEEKNKRDSEGTK